MAERTPSPRFANWTDVELDLEHRRINRWLNVPGSEKWLDQYKAALADMEAIWSEINRRKELRARPVGRLALKAVEILGRAAA